MPSAPTVANRNPQPQARTQQAAPAPIPFTRAARRKSIQAYTGTFALSAGSAVALPPIELPAAGYLRELVVLVQIASTGNSATVANPAVGDLPWNIINQLQITNAAGDSIYVPIPGYQLYKINKYGGIYQPPFCDPRNDPAFVATTTGSGATAGTGSFILRIPFEIDPRDAFCSLPNLAANKAYQISILLSSIATIWAGGTAPNGAVSATITMVMNYWNQPNAINGAGMPQQTEPEGVGSVSLFRLQTVPVGGGGDKTFQITNVGNTIRWLSCTLYDSASPSKRDDTDWPVTTYFRLNNDQLFYKPQTVWLSEMRQAYGYGVAAGTKDTAGNLDTGCYELSEFMMQHGSVEVDSPRDQYLVTLDATLFQIEGANWGSAANNLLILTNEIKPTSAQALYSLNVV
jgi:hypothetical protein